MAKQNHEFDQTFANIEAELTNLAYRLSKIEEILEISEWYLQEDEKS